jgi:hypothetical protein
MSESDLMRRIQLDLSVHDVRLFRNQVGEAWHGNSQIGRGRPAFGPLTVTLQHARRIRFGLCPGSADLVGWKSVTITPDMVGKRLAVFASVEVKDGSGRTGFHQEQWRSQVTYAGGLAGIARSIDDASDILNGVDP